MVSNFSNVFELFLNFPNVLQLFYFFVSYGFGWEVWGCCIFPSNLQTPTKSRRGASTESWFLKLIQQEMDFFWACHKPAVKLGEGLNPICKNGDFAMGLLMFIFIFMLDICLDDVRFIL